MRLTRTSIISEIKLQEGPNGNVPNTIQVLRVGSFNHPQYGKFDITTATLAEMKRNFDNRVRGIDMAFDYFHDSNREASAWVKSLELDADGLSLWATVQWTPAAQKKLNERELRYFSPDFAFAWTDPETGVTYNNVLFGGGLTNRPFVKEMAAIVADENQGDKMTELEKAQARVKELETANLKLTEDAKAQVIKLDEAAAKYSELDAMKKQHADMTSKMADLTAKMSAKEAEVKQLTDEKKMSEKEREFSVLLTEGKACAAQKDAFIKGDMSAFIKLAQPLNLDGKGTVEGGGATGDADDADKVIKLAEEKCKADKSLDMGRAISLVRKELKTK